MGSLQTVAFGAASDGSQGDTTRAAFAKDNANVAVLQAQSALTSFATTLIAPAALTAAQHLGQRVNVNLATAGIIQLPTAASCSADGVILLRNLGTVPVTIAITTGSGDTFPTTVLNALESMLFDTDGIHAWNVLLKGRANSSNETVQGNSVVVGNETVGGTLGVTGNTTLGGTLGVTGASTFTVRPTFNGNTPVDSGNSGALVAPYMPLAGGAFSGAPTYSTAGIARQAFQNITASRALVVGSGGAQNFLSATMTPMGFTALSDAGTNWSGGNTFVTTVAGVYRFVVTVCVASAFAAGSSIDMGLARSADSAVLAHMRTIGTGTAFFNAFFETTITLPASTGYYIFFTGSQAVALSPDTTFNRICIEQIA